MPVLDFTEIATARFGPDRDRFELFARDFLVHHGIEVERGPDRGPDAGRDMIVVERRTGATGSTNVRWLVSCKHKAHSGSAVSISDEQNLRDRIETHHCDGFLAFYSTVVSSGLSANLDRLKPQYELEIYDPERIERELLSTHAGKLLAARYMPRSYSAWAVKVGSSASNSFNESDGVGRRGLREGFLRPPYETLQPALAEAASRDTLVFVVVYDAEHPTRSKLTYALGAFVEYNQTKRLIDQYFTVVVGPSQDPELGQLVPDDYHMELCLWIVMTPSGEVLRREPVYANSDEGLKRVREVIRDRETR